MPDEPRAPQDAPDTSSPSTLDGAPQELALDLTSEAVRLVARSAGGAWTELGAVPLGAGDFRAAIDSLRHRAEEHGALPVTLWLPSTQILVRRYVLKRGDRTAEALRRLAEDTGNRADALTVALSPVGDGQLVTVLGTFKQTVAEAADYARRWGFRPDRVSTRVEAGRFGPAGPAFGLPDPAPRRAGLRAPRALAAAAATLAVGLAGWGAYGLLAPGSVSPVTSAPEATTMTEARAVLSDVAMARAVRHEAAPRDPHPARSADPRASRSAAADEAATREGAPPLTDAPAPPAEPAAGTVPDAAARLARGSAAPDRHLAASRPEAAAPDAAADIGTVLAGIDRIRAEDAGEELAGQPTAPQDEIVLAASDLAPVAVPARPMPRSGVPDRAETALEGDPGAEEIIEAEGSDVPPPAATMSDSRLAAVLAPPPPPRPDRPRRSGSAAAGRTEPAPPRIGNAAAQEGLALDATSLIGVIDANSGREALLRTPSGDYLKVARGDEVAGWRVNAIGQDAMRLTRGGESRTLLLVTR